MPRLLLTDVSIRALKSEQRADFWDTRLKGFGLRVGQNSKTFVVKHHNRRVTLGHYSEQFSLARARSEAKKVLAQDTKTDRTKFGTALPRFIDKYLSRENRAGTAKEAERLLRKHFEPEFGHRAVADITRQQVLAIIDDLSDTPSEARHALGAAKTFFFWSVDRGYINASPLTRAKPPAQNPPRCRVLSDDELKAVWQATGDAALPATFAAIVRLLIVTGQRRGEIAGLRGEFIRNGVCTLPPSLTKNGREHAIPVGTLFASLLPKTDLGLLFPARGLRPFSGWSKSKIDLDRLSGVTGWTLHDLRRT